MLPLALHLPLLALIFTALNAAVLVDPDSRRSPRALRRMRGKLARTAS